MSDLPLTVMLPVYNGERYVAEAIESILSQSFSDYEFLLLDDGSQDRTPDILERYALMDRRIRLLRHSNHGVGFTLNRGIREARGRLLAEIGADDFALPSRLLKQVDFLTRNPDHVLVGGYLGIIDAQGRSIGLRTYPTTDSELRRRIVLYNPFGSPSLMYRRDAAVAAQGYTSRFATSEDYDFIFRLAKQGMVANLPEPLTLYRLHPESGKAKNTGQQLRDTLRIKQTAYSEYGYRESFTARLVNLTQAAMTRIPPRLTYWLFTRAFISSGESEPKLVSLRSGAPFKAGDHVPTRLTGMQEVSQRGPRPKQRCGLCGGDLLEGATVPGYQEPDSFEIWDCQRCHTMVADPRQADPAVYDAIYAVPGGAPGYDRYFQLAQRAKRTGNAMRYLASKQDALWGVERALGACQARRILDVGCGLGYLTYALRQTGHEAFGIDVSEKAVAYARENYGDYFFAESIESHALRSKAIYDAIVMVELIEHLEDPVTLLESTLPLLAPGGQIVVTTPNRTYLGYDAPWATDLPPVHLWWFSEESVRAIGDRLNCSVSFVDFTEYNQKYPIFRTYRSLQVPMFNSSGQLVRRESRPLALLRRLGILHETYWLISATVGLARRPAQPRRQVIVASLKPGSERVAHPRAATGLPP